MAEMKTHSLKSTVCDFLSRHCHSSRPILLALSGGPDSLALLYLLHELKQDRDLKFAAAHVDHRWRSSSALEAEQLKRLAAELDVPFHLKVLDPQAIGGNQEAICREQRLAFFKSLSQQYGYQAVLLAHHADDQAETVLKRLLEGAGLTSMEAMREQQIFEGLVLWRPLLKIRKKEILQLISHKGLIPIDDDTNRDVRFLRAKFRTRVIPWLEEDFGKQVTPTLNRISREAAELNAYLDVRIEPYLSKVFGGPFGLMLNLQDCSPLPKVEFKHLLRHLGQQMHLSLSYQELELAFELTMSNKADKQLRSDRALIQIDRKRLFLLKEPLECNSETIELSPDLKKYGNWSIQIKEIQVSTSNCNLPASNWLSAWHGEMDIILPKGRYLLAPAQVGSSYPGSSSISKWWGDAKIPAFFRNVLPLVKVNENDMIFHEFLTGHRKFPLKVGEEALHLQLKY